VSYFTWSLTNCGSDICVDIITCLSSAFQRINRNLLGRMLCLDDSQLGVVIKGQGWSEEDGLVCFPLNEYNSDRRQQFSENLSLDHLSRVLAMSGR